MQSRLRHSSLGMVIGVPFGGGGQSWESYWARQDWDNIARGGLYKLLLSADAYIKSSDPTYNYGSSTIFVVGEINSAVSVYRSVLKFDLSTIPEGAIIDSAIMTIRIKTDISSNARTLRVYRLKKAFVEGTGNGSATGDGVTWNTRDGSNNWTTAGAFDEADCEQVEIGSIDLTATEIEADKNITLNVASLAALDLGYGFLLKMDTETDDAYTYYYRGELVKYPYLTLNWHTTAGGSVSSLLTKYTSNPLFEGAFGSIVYEGVGQYSYYYCKTSERYVHKRSSSDGLTWGAESNVLDVVAGKDVEVASAWKEGSTWYMLFRSNEWGGSKAIGLATSADGNTWTKEATNPVITNTDVGAWCTGDIDPWGIIKVGATYYLWLNDVNEVPRQSGLMTSTDLINWTPDANNPIFDNGRYCGMPIKYGSNYYMFICYTPFGNIVGAAPWSYRIELYRDSDPRFLSTSREYLGIVMLGGENTEWDDDYLDTPSIVTETIQRDTFPLGDAENGKLWMYYTGHSGTVWAHGLAVGHLEMLGQLTALTEPGAGE